MKCRILLTASVLAASAFVALGQAVVLEADGEGGLRMDGKPFRAIGINYFSCFYRTLLDGNDMSYEQGFEILAREGIPFVRFAATGFWPKDMALYLSDREEYFRRFDAVVASAGKHGIGLIPSLFWFYACVPDLVGEPMDQWGNPESKVHEWMREYVREVVTRYRDSPAIWAWEMGNEFALQASLPNAACHRAPIWPNLETADSRSERDDLTFDMLRVAYAEFGKAVREHDKKRLIFTGDSIPRPAAWHMEKEGTWTADNEQQFLEMLGSLNPDPIDAISIHAYGADTDRIAWSVRAAESLKKPLFIGEFGVPGTGPEVEMEFRSMLRIIEESPIPLAALWVFDLPSQNANYNITANNARSYQLREVAEANARVQSEWFIKKAND
ncbi:MAG: cellulase family glycosylhydrolase [Akkermansiaceae bacterium]